MGKFGSELKVGTYLPMVLARPASARQRDDSTTLRRQAGRPAGG